MILYVLSGLPGAGKSTRAREIVSETGAIMVSRDEQRDTFRNLHCEATLSWMLVVIAQELLKLGSDVVVDSWNLHPGDEENWLKVAKETGADLHWYHIATPVETCVARDAERPNPVGMERVRETARLWAERLDQLGGGLGSRTLDGSSPSHQFSRLRPAPPS